MNNIGTWTSSSTGKIKYYCKTCRVSRATVYSLRVKNADGNHTRKQWLAKLAEYDVCPGCKSPWNDIPMRPDKRYKYVWTKDYNSH
ncbi:hypothetical protein ACLI09_16055 [Flavobacterium sp. RHBU_24]|uniref:hypothetical protein n=1 Tax=Flavobacterium sp. RHBU_24 TaxID=3391185 RepID=UPI0039847354